MNPGKLVPVSEPPNDPEPLPFILITSDQATTADIQLAAATFGQEMAGDPQVPDFLPSSPWEGRCRICGEHRAIDTAEHIPPRAASNKGRSRTLDVVQQLTTGGLEPGEPIGPTVQGGVRAYTICESCNNSTGTAWGRAYSEFVGHTLGAAQQAIGSEEGLRRLDESPDQHGLRLRLPSIYPARVARQAISCMLSLSGSSDLAENHPALRDLVLGGDAMQLPPPIRLYLRLYLHPVGRLIGGPGGQARLDTQSGRVDRFLQLDHPPVGLVLQVDGLPDSEIGNDITWFTMVDVDDQRDVELDIPVGFGHKPWPTEYRSRGQLLAAHIDPG